jgi:nitrate reductase molybdenum cofactor assembly chaperone NarJ/NarW
MDSAVAAATASLLLRYPDVETLGALAKMRPAVVRLPASLSYPLGRVIVHRACTHPAILGTEYLELFGYRGPCRLHLTHYTAGGTRQRARALLRFAVAFEAAGYEVDAGEPPDFLPAVLDLAAGSGEPGWALLREHRAALDQLAAALDGQGSPYRHVVHAVGSMLPQPVTAEPAAALWLSHNGVSDWARRAHAR